MKHKNITITLKDEQGNTELATFPEGEIAVDPLGFLVIEQNGMRDFFPVDKIDRWGYEVGQEDGASVSPFKLVDKKIN